MIENKKVLPLRVKKLIYSLFILVFGLVNSAHAQTDTGYTNPILRGLNADPSICRVGNDFYAVTSTMYLYPGVPVYHSKDLINWEMIGYCLTRPEHFFPQLNNRSPMMYATTLRYNKGVFYMITTDVAGGGNFFVTAKDPAGPWSDPVLVDKPVFDPSLFFDDNGKVYYTRRGDFKDKNIVQAEIDIKTGKLLTPLRGISKGLVSDDTEGPHLFKRNGWYYITMGEGGSRALHMQTIARSKSPWGPFEKNPNNPVITQNHAWWHHIRALGHADFVDAPDGSSWAVCLGTRHYGYDDFSAIGRETFLLPVQWVDGWPVVKDEYKRTLHVNAKTLPLHPWVKEQARDDFDNNALALKWNMLAYPFTQWYNLTERKGFLRLKGTADPLVQTKQVAFIGTRQKEMKGEAIAAFEFKPLAENEEAGISVFQQGAFHYDLFVTMRNNKQVVVLKKFVGDIVAETNVTEISGSRFEMKIAFDPANYVFSFKQNNEWKEVGRGLVNLISTEVAAVWSGAFLGMYSTGNGKPCVNAADFDWFETNFEEVTFDN